MVHVKMIVKSVMKMSGGCEWDAKDRSKWRVKTSVTDPK